MGRFRDISFELTCIQTDRHTYLEGHLNTTDHPTSSPELAEVITDTYTCTSKNIKLNYRKAIYYNPKTGKMRFFDSVLVFKLFILHQTYFKVTRSEIGACVFLFLFFFLSYLLCLNKRWEMKYMYFQFCSP